MIPCKLSLKNFLSYGEHVPPLDLEGVHVACLCGANGNGKSALLDAVTWALWGKARDSRDDDLLRMHCQDMEVALEFDSGGNRYRVIRRHSRAAPRRAARADLELQLWDGAAFHPIGGSTMRETQAKIIETLRLDYETFVNSAYLVQGQADRFSLKGAAERKELLGNILGLAAYERLADDARARSKELAATGLALDTRLQALEQELAQQPAQEEERARAQALLAELEPALQQAQARLDGLAGRAQALQQQQERLRELQESARRAAKELADAEVQARWHQERIAVDTAVAARAAVTETEYAALRSAREQYEAGNLSLSRLHALEQQRGLLALALQSARAGLESQLAVQQSQARALRAQAQHREQLERDLAAAQARRRDLAALERQAQQRAEAAVVLDSDVRTARAALEGLLLQGQDTKKKLELLERAQAQCPLCGGDLDAAGRARLQRQFQAERQGLLDAWQRLDADARRQDSDLASARQEAAALQARLRVDVPAADGGLAVLERELASAHDAESQANAAERATAALQSSLDNHDYARAEQQGLAALQAQIEALAYDAPAHDALRRRVEALAPAEAAFQRLQEAQRRLPEEQAALARIEAQLAARRQEQAALASRIESLQGELAAQAGLEPQLASARQELADLQVRHTAALSWRAKLEERLRLLAQRESEHRSLASQRDQARDDQASYELLTQAFGKTGIPAHVIEAAVPEIEAEANRLLARMTDNRMHLDIQTQRERKAGGLVETLDIRVSDELGTRPYELFSGGEAFRINFALRIALSKLLARRAGAPLPTLIVDEGFGTQDGAGRERLVDAINAVQDDFQRILVISHLDDIRDAFPIQIEVTKTDEGSMIRVG